MRPCCETAETKRTFSANAILGLIALVLVSIVLVSTNAFGATKKETVKVWGNCGMCKKTIEKAAKGVTGVQSANWNMDTHQFTVTFDPAQTSVDKVHQAIAAAGYDTDVVKGNDEAYNNLHGCCQYERRQ
jgi:copper chaperone CopZ